MPLLTYEMPIILKILISAICGVLVFLMVYVIASKFNVYQIQSMSIVYAVLSIFLIFIITSAIYFYLKYWYIVLPVIGVLVLCTIAACSKDK